jgi:hypothetical protein
MNSKLSRAILALLIGISFPIFTGNQVVSAAPAVSGTLGDSCVTPFISRVIAADITGTTEIAGVCFPSLNNPDIFIWSKDNNPIPAYTLVTDNDGKIAFGRSCVINDQNDCSIPDPKPSGYLAVEPFVRAYPDTRHFADNNNLSRFSETFGGIWWSETYYSNIVPANYVAPEVIVETEDTTQFSDPTTSTAVSSALLIGLAAVVSLTTAAAGASSSQQTQSKSESPDAPELLRARKERRFAHANRFGNVFLGSVASMDRWAFFTKKLPALIRRIGKFSSTAATSIGDADYLRAVLGIFSMLMYPAAVLIGVFMSINSEETMPIPTLIWIAAALILGCFDSLAGAISALTFFIVTVICNQESIPEDKWRYLATIIMIFVITTGPGLFAGALRRFDGVHTNRSGKWERLVDYALSPIVTAWVVFKGLELIQTVSGEEFSGWPGDIKYVARIVFVCIFIRYFIEGYVAKHFADRINEIVTESVPMNKFNKIRVHIFKAIWITFVAYVLLVKVSGLTDIKSILVLGFLLLLPALGIAFGIKPIDKISKFNITGTPRFAILLCAVLSLTYIFEDRKWQEEIWLFVGIAFAPILYFNLMEALARSHLKSPAYFYQTRNGRLLYQLSSVLLYILILGIMFDKIGRGSP